MCQNCVPCFVDGHRSNHNDAWEKVANLLSNELGTTFTATQCYNKFDNEKDAWKVCVACLCGHEFELVREWKNLLMRFHHTCRMLMSHIVIDVVGIEGSSQKNRQRLGSQT